MAERLEKIVRLRVSGHVQGVGYRAWTVREANSHRLRGWVRNLGSGDVEAILAGPEPDVDAMIESCRRGPRYAMVTSIDVEAADESALISASGGRGFHQLDTY